MKRANGTGTIVKKPGRAKPWIVYGGAYRQDGKRVIPFLGSFEKKGDAQTCLDHYNINPQMIRTKMTFEQIYNEFKAGKRYRELSKSQKDCYAAAYNHCAPLHRLPFAELRTVQFQNVIDTLEEKGLSISTMQKVKVLLTVLSDHAIQTDAASRNYATFLVLPAAPPSDKRALNDIELKKIDAAAAAGNQAAQWVEYLLHSGWRISEMLELTRFQYDAAERTFRGGKKTRNAINRLVPVHPDVQQIVDAQLAKNGDTVFCMSSGKPMSANYFRKKMFDPLLKELGLDESLTPHACRHTFATRLKLGGADEFWRKRLLGHSAGDVTNDIYTHDDVESLRAAVLCYNPQPEDADEEKKKEAG